MGQFRFLRLPDIIVKMSLAIEDIIQCLILTPILTWSAIVFIVASVYHFLVEVLESSDKPPTLHYKKSAFSTFLFGKIETLKQPYRPPFWGRNAHIQTLVSSYSLPTSDVEFDRQFLQLKDRGLIALDWGILPDDPRPVFKDCCSASTPVSNCPIVFILPNLTRSALESSDVCQEAIDRGLRPIIFNRRGYGGCPLATPRFQSYSDPMDFRQAVKYIMTRFPKTRITAIGFGTGADLLLAYLGEFGSSSYLVAAVAISPLFDPEHIYSEGMPFPYGTLRLLTMKKLLCNHAGALEKTIDIHGAMATRTLGEFEKMVFGTMANCESLEQYWEKNGPLRDADDISAPVLCISSKDDPLVPSSVIPYDIFKLYPQFLLAETIKGGHCGFLQRTANKYSSWANLLAMDFLQASLEFESVEESPNKTRIKR